MNETAIKLLEYDKIKENAAGYAISEKAKEMIKKLHPSTDRELIEGWQEETTEARMIVDARSSVPLDSLTGIEKVMGKLGKGSVLQPDELMTVSKLLESVKRIKKYMEGMQSIAPRVSSYALSMFELEEVAEEIDRCIRHGRVDDKASSELSKIRKRIGIAEDRIKQKLDSILRSPVYADCIQDAVVSMRDNRFVIPVKKEYRRNIDGNVMDTSSSGSTIFVEPEAVRKLQDELNMLRLEEENEVYRILSSLTNLVETHWREVSINIEGMAQYDFLIAKGKYSRALDCYPIEIDDRYDITVIQGRHPLIAHAAVPLDFAIGRGYRALVITGPNTGGKTVALKTVGLLTMMVQSGLHVPVAKGSRFAIFKDILVDIGDGQSIEQSLSTFSSHIKNISYILEAASKDSLVIVDELGAGTEPGEGTGLAIAVLEEIFKKGATLLATTHYSEIKGFADEKEGFENGSMEFDVNTLKPLYKLKIGKPGESNAFLIALRLGIDPKIVERAHEVTYKERKSYKDVCNGPATAVIEKSIEEEKRIEPTQEYTSLRIKKEKIQKQKMEPSFKIGDCVFISSMKRTGIVCESENSKGEVGIMVMKKKLKINKKRLTLHIDGSELYPDDYDMDIVLESKENRKKKHIMNRKYVKGLTIEKVKGTNEI
ncbi:MAG: endonuclease MutS2 [Bacillota bacterium]